MLFELFGNRLQVAIRPPVWTSFLCQIRVDRLQRVRRMQMAHYLDALRRAVAPPPPDVAPPFNESLGTHLMSCVSDCHGSRLCSAPANSCDETAARHCRLSTESLGAQLLVNPERSLLCTIYSHCQSRLHFCVQQNTHCCAAYCSFQGPTAVRLCLCVLRSCMFMHEKQGQSRRRRRRRRRRR